MNQISTALKNSIIPVDRILKLIWAGQFISLGIYVFIATRAAATETPKDSPIALLLSAQAAFMIVLFFVFSRLLTSPRAVVSYHKRGYCYRILSIMRHSSQNLFSNKTEPAGLNETENMLYSYSSAFFQLQIILWGILHTAALFGMVISTTTGQPVYSITASSLVGVVMLSRVPSLERLLNDSLIELQLAPPSV